MPFRGSPKILDYEGKQNGNMLMKTLAKFQHECPLFPIFHIRASGVGASGNCFYAAQIYSIPPLIGERSGAQGSYVRWLSSVIAKRRTKP
jgi:hypothetical protein